MRVGSDSESGRSILFESRGPGVFQGQGQTVQRSNRCVAAGVRGRQGFDHGSRQAVGTVTVVKERQKRIKKETTAGRRKECREANPEP